MSARLAVWTLTVVAYDSIKRAHACALLLLHFLHSAARKPWLAAIKRVILPGPRGDGQWQRAPY